MNTCKGYLLMGLIAFVLLNGQKTNAYSVSNAVEMSYGGVFTNLSYSLSRHGETYPDTGRINDLEGANQLTQASSIMLQDNKISLVDNDAFSGLGGLASLDLSGNDITIQQFRETCLLEPPIL